MVCLGNICRSPLAQGILESKLKSTQLDVYVDSAGTGSWHVGHKPDVRSIDIAKKNDIDISNQKARQFNTYDFNEFDEIFVMDSSNYRDVTRLASSEIEINKIKLLLNEILPSSQASVPDPYYGGENGFKNVFELIDKACDKIVDRLIKNV